MRLAFRIPGNFALIGGVSTTQTTLTRGTTYEEGRTMLKEFCNLYRNDVRKTCIEKDWYTRGTSAEYEELFDYIRDNAEGGIPTGAYVETLRHIAEDILAHSETDYELEDIMTVLAGKCMRYFVDIQ